jgi:hypothetical protein
MASGIGPIGNLLGKVNSSGALVVTLDGGTASATKFLAANGTAGAPSYSFTNDTDSGIYLGAAGVVKVSIGGTDLFQIDDNPSVQVLGSATFRIGTDVVLSRGAANVLTLASGDSFSLGGAPGAATTSHRLIKKVTGIADAVATDVITVTVPNANHAASIKVTLLSSNGSTDAFESSRTAEGAVVVARTTGANAVAAAATLELAQIATVAAGATHTLAYGVSAISGAVGATNTFTIQVTINDSGNVGSNQVVVLAELINAEATGVTMA